MNDKMSLSDLFSSPSLTKEQFDAITTHEPPETNSKILRVRQRIHDYLDGKMPVEEYDTSSDAVTDAAAVNKDVSDIQKPVVQAAIPNTHHDAVPSILSSVLIGAVAGMVVGIAKGMKDIMKE